VATLIRKNGAYVRYNGSYAIDPKLCDCVCKKDDDFCSTLPDELELEVSICGHTFIETLTKVADRTWEIACDSQYSIDCDGQPCGGGGIINTSKCYQFVCVGSQFYLSIGASCVSGRCVTSGGIIDVEPDSISLDPFEAIFYNGLPPSGNACCDDPPCYDTPTITVRLP